MLIYDYHYHIGGVEMIKKSLIILGLFILCRVCTANHIHINNSESNAGDWVEIPIEVKYEDKVAGLMF